MKLYILADNRTRKRGFLAEHGLSLFLEQENSALLFDTGQSDVYRRNAALMGADLGKTDCVVLSHGHYDHCGGMRYFPVLDRRLTIYAHEAAFAGKYVLEADGTTYREIGIPWTREERETLEKHLVLTKKKTRIASGVYLCGEIPGVLPFEKASKNFYREEGTGKSLDPMKDEQMLVYDGEKGLSLFLGCSHPGIVNCLHYALSLFPGKRIHTLAAGMHLDGASPARLQTTIRHMLALDIQKVIPLHCTGIAAICEMKRAFGDRCLPLCAGDALEL